MNLNNPTKSALFAKTLLALTLSTLTMSAMAANYPNTVTTGPLGPTDTVATAATSEHGVHASGVGSVISINGSTIGTIGQSAFGVYVDTGGTINLTGDVSVSTTNAGAASTPGSPGLIAVNVGSSIVGTSGTITINTTGGSAIAAESSEGIRAFSGASISLDKANVTTQGNYANALQAIDSVSVPGTTITINGDYTANTSGIVAIGALAGDSSIAGTVNLLGKADVTTNGNNSFGLASMHAGSTLTVAGQATVNTAGTTAYAVYADVSGVINLNNGANITTTGTGTFGVYAINGGVVTLTTPTSGKTNINSTGNSFDATIGNATITASLSGSTISSSAGLLANSFTAGVINITADNATTMTGGTAVDGTSMLNITQNDAASIWNMPIYSTITSLTNAGTLKFTNTAPGISLNFAADYVGNAGKVILNTALGDDTSATDQMIVAGNTSGTSTVTINNIGGLGAATTVGIPVITVAGNSNAVFTLSNPVIVGGFEYKLVKGGNPLNPGNPKNWYLVSAPYVAVSAPIPATGLAGLLALFTLLAIALVFKTKKHNKGFKPLVEV